MNISMLLTLAVGLYALVAALIGFFKAGKRSWLMAAVRLAVTAASAVVAIPVTQAAMTFSSDYAFDLVLPLLPEMLGGFLTEVPVGAEGMRALAAMLGAPVLYLLIFIVIRWLLSIVVWIIEKILPFLRKRSLRALAMPLGALNGLLFVAVTLVPLCGFLMLGSHMLNTFVEADLAETALVQDLMGDLEEEDVAQLAADIEENPVVSLVHGTVGKPIFATLTTATLDATETHGVVVKLDLEGELCGLLKTAGYALEVMDSFEKETYTAEDKLVLFATADSFFESEWVKLVATDTLVAMSQNWIAGQEFAGMARPKLDASLNPTLNRILELLASENGETLEEDIHVILDVVGDLLVHDLLTEDTDYAAMVQRMGQSGLLTDMLGKLEANERMHSLAAELKALGIRLVTNMLGVDQLKGGEYADMMGNVAGTLTDALSKSQEERDALVLDAIKNNFGEQGFDVPDDVALQMSHQMIDELGADGEITADELTEYMVTHADQGFEMVPGQIPDEVPGLTE